MHPLFAFENIYTNITRYTLMMIVDVRANPLILRDYYILNAYMLHKMNTKTKAEH